METATEWMPLPSWLVMDQPVLIVRVGGWRPELQEGYRLVRRTKTQVIVAGERGQDRRFNLTTLREQGADRGYGFELIEPDGAEAREIRSDDARRSATQEFQVATEELRLSHTPERIRRVHDAFPAWAEHYPRPEA